MSSILGLTGIVFILIALTAGKRRHKVYRYSMLGCIVTSAMLAGYHVFTDSNILLAFLNLVLVAVATGALFISEKINREKISDAGEHL